MSAAGHQRAIGSARAYKEEGRRWPAGFPSFSREEEWEGLEEVELWPEGTDWQAANGDEGGPEPP